MTTRRWMIVVMMIGVALGGVEWLRRRRAFALEMASHHFGRFLDGMNPPGVIKDFGPIKKCVDYHMDLEFKWREAARHPWLPFEPDPPEPEWDFRGAFEDQ